MIPSERSAHDTTPAPEDRALLERVRSAFSPPEMGAGRAAAFDAELSRRIESRGRRATLWVPASALAAAAVAVWAGSLLWSAAATDTRLMADPSSTWESELILGSDVVADASGDYLPEDYLVIADAFFSE